MPAACAPFGTDAGPGPHFTSFGVRTLCSSMADAGVRQASADRTAALITADEMVFIDNPPNAGPIEHSTPGVDGELAPPRRSFACSAAVARGHQVGEGVEEGREPRTDERGLAHPGHQRAAATGLARAFSAIASNGLPAHCRTFVF